MIEAALNKIAEHILGLDEASLVMLWHKYKERMDNFEVSKDWEKSVIIFFIINAVRAKNQIFNEEILKLEQSQQTQKKSRNKITNKPRLKRIK